jgi:hypothetical protein
VQVIEVTGYAVRSAVITMRRKGTPLQFVLFPMFHIGSPAFYQQVRLRLAACDVIVLEGIHGKSREVSALTMAYRFVPKRSRNGLVEQDDATLLPAGATVICPDASAQQVAADLRRLPRLTRMLLLVFAPIMGLVYMMRGPQSYFDEDLVVDDLPLTHRAEWLERDNPFATASTRRDRMLLDALAEIHQRRCQEPITVAVVYGAGHVPAIANGLMSRFGYRPREAEWITVVVPQ